MRPPQRSEEVKEAHYGALGIVFKVGHTTVGSCPPPGGGGPKLESHDKIPPTLDGSFFCPDWTTKKRGDIRL